MGARSIKRQTDRHHKPPDTLHQTHTHTPPDLFERVLGVSAAGRKLSVGALGFDGGPQPRTEFPNHTPRPGR